MDRLTRVIDLHNALPLATAGIEIEEPESYAYGYAVDILSAYEDTGLKPNHVKQMKWENATLKRLLKLAVEAMANGRPICENCKRLDTDECVPKADCSCFEWHYADEVKGLIENGNELDSGD